MPKIVDHDQHREELLNSCFTLFATKGFADVTMREIADELGVSTGTLYHYFHSKQGILEQMFQMINVRDVNQALTMMDESLSKIERLKRFLVFVRERKEYFQNLLFITIDYFRYRTMDDAEDVLQDFVDFYRGAMAENIQLPQDLADFLFIYLNGLMYHVRLFPRSVDVDDQLRLVENMIECMITSSPKPG